MQGSSARADLRADWVALPSSRSPRWFLQRELAAVDAYASGSGIHAAESWHLFGRYLDVSGAMLEPSAPGRGARVRIRLKACLRSSDEARSLGPDEART
jgi:hypothetical protein